MNLKALLGRHQDMVSERSNNDALFQELKDLVRQDTTNFNAGSTRAQDARFRQYDSTAPWALEQLAGGLHSYNTNPNDRWMDIGVTGVPVEKLAFEEKNWLEGVGERIYAHYSDPFANFNSSLHEVYMDIGALGTAVMFQWYDIPTGRLMFRAFPLGDCWISEGSDGIINRLHRKIMWTVEQIKEEFGYLPEKLAKLKATDKCECIHAVYLNDQFDPKLRTKTSKRYASVYFCKSTEEELNVSGYDYFPYHVPRWVKVVGDVYGRAPALSVLAEIRMVNAMRKTVIRAAQKMVDPPLQVPDDGFILPLRHTPGSTNLRRPGADEIKPMPTAQRIDVGTDQIEQSREMIRRGFYVDWLVRSTKKERQTTMEISDERGQMLSMLAPVTGRLQGELLGPMVRLSYALLYKHGEIDAMPETMRQYKLGVTYLSPAARAQNSVRGQGLQVYVDRISQLQPVFPEITDAIDPDGLNAELADSLDVPRRVLATPEAVQKKRDQRAQQQQLAAATTAVPAAASAAKDFAAAQAGGLQLPGMGG